jgi:hypothetical protein
MGVARRSLGRWLAAGVHAHENGPDEQGSPLLRRNRSSSAVAERPRLRDEVGHRAQRQPRAPNEASEHHLPEVPRRRHGGRRGIATEDREPRRRGLLERDAERERLRLWQPAGPVVAGLVADGHRDVGVRGVAGAGQVTRIRPSATAWSRTARSPGSASPRDWVSTQSWPCSRSQSASRRPAQRSTRNLTPTPGRAGRLRRTSTGSPWPICRHSSLQWRPCSSERACVSLHKRLIARVLERQLWILITSSM